MKRISLCILSCVVVASVMDSCTATKKIQKLNDIQVKADLSLPVEKQVDFHEFKDTYKPADTLMVVDFDGHQSLIMNAVREEESGEMVASDVIQAAVVTARFRNVPERHGKIDLEFQIRVPEEMLEKEWQIRFSPRMEILGDTLSLDEVYVTGSEYRREQDRGYMRYRKFINSIITDSTLLVNMGQLELYIERNIPDLYAFKQDSTWYRDAEFASVFGVTEQQAIEHYTYRFLKYRNNRRIANKEKMFHRYIKSPYATGVRLDTVIVDPTGGYVYNYIQTIDARPKLRKVDILLGGEIYEQEKKIYTMPAADPLTFYISSLSSFVSDQERYLTKTIYRQAEANTACYIDFQLGRAEVNDTLSNNATEIGRIKKNLAGLLENKEFDLDSIVVTASCSPEGSIAVNAGLSKRRGDAAAKYFQSYVKHYCDSLIKEKGISYNLDETYVVEETLNADDIKFLSKVVPENWVMLDNLVCNDVVLNDGDKEEYFSHEVEQNFDVREQKMQKDRMYKYYREVLYPRVRTVKFDFYLHRKGMVEESVQTTVLDSVYMDGVQAIRDRDYEKAVALLRPYNDFNTAVAYCALDYNASALAILETLDKTAEVNYMLAVIYSRQGKDREAVQCYLDACKQNSSYVHRGNLDPEISALIKTYGLNKQEDEFDYSF